MSYSRKHKDIRAIKKLKIILQAYFDVKKGVVRIRGDDFEGDFSSPTIEILKANLQKTKGELEFLWFNENAKLLKERACFEKSLRSEITTAERKRFIARKIEELDGCIESARSEKEASEKLIENYYKVLIAIYARYVSLFRKGRRGGR